MKIVDTLKWVKEEARANADFQISCADAMEKQASTLLNFLLAGAGGALAYAVNLTATQDVAWLQAAMAATSLWLFFVAAILLMRVLWSRPIYGPANDPKNLEAAYEMQLADALAFDLEQRQSCIENNRARNDTVGIWLNICRSLAIATPLVFIATLSVVFFLGH
jgi:hypothetical protein